MYCNVLLQLDRLLVVHNFPTATPIKTQVCLMGGKMLDTQNEKQTKQTILFTIIKCTRVPLFIDCSSSSSVLLASLASWDKCLCPGGKFHRTCNLLDQVWEKWNHFVRNKYLKQKTTVLLIIVAKDMIIFLHKYYSH